MPSVRRCLREQAVQLHAQVTAASAVQGLAVHHHGEIRVLKRGVRAQDCIVRLNDRCREMRSRHFERQCNCPPISLCGTRRHRPSSFRWSLLGTLWVSSIICVMPSSTGSPRVGWACRGVSSMICVVHPSTGSSLVGTLSVSSVICKTRFQHG